MTTGFRIREAEQADADGIHELLPELASFDLPARRDPEHLWRGDADLLLRWYRGEAPDSHIHVAVADGNTLLGLTIITLRPELLSSEPSAHLEVIVVSRDVRGTGIGRTLLRNAERTAREHGARSMSLHVFANNTGARDFYARYGYEGELMRYIKTLQDG